MKIVANPVCWTLMLGFSVLLVEPELNNGGIALAHKVEGIPPFSAIGEQPANDLEFINECERAALVILEDLPDNKISKQHCSISKKFGLVCRFDFGSSEDPENTVNRIMLWRHGNGDLAEFIGFDIPAPPLD